MLKPTHYMKINLKTITYIITAVIIYGLLLALSMFIRIKHIRIDQSANHILLTLIEVFYLSIMVYLINFLKYLKEKKSVIVVFIIFITYDILAFLYGMFAKSIGATIQINAMAGLACLIISILLFTYTFRIKTKEFAPPFRFFGGAFIFILLFKMIVPIIMILHYNQTLRPYTALVELLIPLAILNILFKAYRYLQKEQAPQFVNY